MNMIVSAPNAKYFSNWHESAIGLFLQGKAFSKPLIHGAPKTEGNSSLT